MNINELKGMIKEVINESSLSRVHKHVSEHDCAILTAFRGDPKDNSSCADGQQAPATYQDDKLDTDSINKLNNRDLRAVLLKSRYGVTDVDGSFIEDFGELKAKEVSEDSLFAVNLNDDPGFVDNIKKFGKRYCQDSILIIPKGGKDAYLSGTNNSSFPGLDADIIVGSLTLGRSAEFMTKVRGRPFTMTEHKKLEVYEDLQINSKMLISRIAEKFTKMEK